jgi:hypothetical protein
MSDYADGEEEKFELAKEILYTQCRLSLSRHRSLIADLRNLPQPSFGESSVARVTCLKR